MAANHEDAALVMQILRWGAEIGLDEAMHEIFAEGFDPDAATADDEAVRTILQFGETVATLVKHKTLDKDLVEDLWWIDGVWARVGPTAKKARERLGEPRLYENFEALATG
jgi:DNA polymerase III delta subunit